MPKQLITPQRRLSRRDTLRLAGAAGAMALAGRNLAEAPGSAQETTTPACVLSPALTEGPYFVDEMLNRSDIRTDPSDNSVQPGAQLDMSLVVQRVDNGSCSPLTGATVDIWHCSALGVYSDEAANNSVGKRFLRGYQVTDENGVVKFTTVYPGWYRGRAVHIHFKVRLFSGSQKTYEFTSQLFFGDTLTDTVYLQAPYSSQGARDVRNSADGIYQQAVNDGTGRKSGDLLLLPATKTDQGYAGTFDIGVTLT